MSRKTACLLRFVCFGHLGVHFCQFWDFARKILDLTVWSESFPRARRTRREGVRVGVRGYVKAGVQWLYAQIRSDLSEHPFEAADGPGISVVSTGRRPCCGVWEFCAFWRLADFVVPKCGPGHILTLLAFGPVSLRLLDLGVLHAWYRLVPPGPVAARRPCPPPCPWALSFGLLLGGAALALAPPSILPCTVHTVTESARTCAESRQHRTRRSVASS